MSSQASLADIFGQSLIYSSAIVAIGSVELNSRLDLVELINTPLELQQAEKDLHNFIAFTLFWTVGTSIVMHQSHGQRGVLINILISVVVTFWFYQNYRNALEKVGKKISQEPATKAQLKATLRKALNQLETLN